MKDSRAMQAARTLADGQPAALQPDGVTQPLSFLEVLSIAQLRKKADLHAVLHLTNRVICACVKRLLDGTRLNV